MVARRPEHEGTPLPFPEIDPIAFEIGPFAVRWYALAYLGGVLLGLLYGASLLNRRSLWAAHTPPMKPGEFFDFAFWAVIGIVVGGRLGYVLFYSPAYFLANPLEILEVWTGGMAFHGGAVGLALAMIVWAGLKKRDILSGLDLLAAVAPIGLFLGRVANFVNAELYGSETTMPWGVVFPGAGDLPRHPTQLYEAALEGLVLFLILRWVTHVAFGLRKPGLVAGLFGVGYAAARILVEFWRLPDAHIGYLYEGWMTMGMVLSLPILIAGLALVTWALRPPRRRD